MWIIHQKSRNQCWKVAKINLNYEKIVKNHRKFFWKSLIKMDKKCKKMIKKIRKMSENGLKFEKTCLKNQEIGKSGWKVKKIDQ